MIIGITGGIGSGKSTVARIMEDLGFMRVDVDRIYHGMLTPGSSVYNKIYREFGPDYFNRDGMLDRRRLGELVFSDPDKFRLLMSLTHPEIKKRTAAVIEKIKTESKNAVLDHPLLFEMKMENLTDEIWVVAAPEEERLERIMRRDGLSYKQAQKRIRAQMSEEEKVKRADVVIRNTGNMEDLKRTIKKLWEERFDATQGGANRA